MIVLSSTGGPGFSGASRGLGPLLASVDVEWTKDYRLPGGNKPFCYSVVWIPAPARAAVDESLDWGFTSVYIERDAERGDLVELAALDLAAAMDDASHLVGHQLCSDLGVLAAHAPDSARAAVQAARDLWRGRRAEADGGPIDTRYDSDAVLRGRSRRLVDVCAEVGLGVEQPELCRSSMTALHRAWLAGANAEARERITVLNLRHSLSAALVALIARDLAPVERPLNVNRLLARRLPGTLDWLGRREFAATLA